jgi:hypothetical protein
MLEFMRFFFLAPSCLALLGCGANVVFGEDGGDGGGGGGSGGNDPTTSSTMTTNTSVTSTSTGILTCDDHQDCPGQLCQFATGLCIDACGLDLPCDPGTVCTSCATSGCAECLDCIDGCLPHQVTPCDSHDDCGVTAGEDVCVFNAGICAQRCGPGSPPCPPDQVCQSCATSSCPGCEDCIDACVFQFK